MGTKTLHIIGNGFDLHHGLKTSYGDFRNWLENNDFGLLTNINFYYGGQGYNKDGKDLLWVNFEDMLGQRNPREMLEIFSGGVSEQESIEDLKDAYLIDDVWQGYNRLHEKLSHAFGSWIRTLHVDSIQVDNSLKIKKDDLFLTFNYTETLEKVYGIPSKNILHIHGQVGGNIIFGHGNSLFDNSWYTQFSNWPFIVDAYIELTNGFNGLRKPVHSIIKNNAVFWNSIADVREIYVWGHSLGDVDWPYFEKIKDSVSVDSEWNFSVHKNNNKRLNELRQKGRLNAITCNIFDF